jgi:hypothetical protein
VLMALTPLKAGRGEGGFKEGKSRQRITASTRRLQGAELGSGVVEGGQNQRWHDRAQAMREEGDDRWGMRRGRFPAIEVEAGRGASVACGPAGSGEEGGIMGRGGPVRRPRLAGLISIGENQKGFDFRM